MIEKRDILSHYYSRIRFNIIFLILLYLPYSMTCDQLDMTNRKSKKDNKSKGLENLVWRKERR